MLIPIKTRASPACFEFSICFRSFLISTGPKTPLLLLYSIAFNFLSQSSQLLFVQRVQVGNALHRALCSQSYTDASPSPSMFITPRLPQFSTAPCSSAGQSTFTQR